MEQITETNLLYMKNFYLLFTITGFTPQLVEQTVDIDNDLMTQQLVEQLGVDVPFLLELGTGFAYVGKEYRLQIDDSLNRKINAKDSL